GLGLLDNFELTLILARYAVFVTGLGRYAAQPQHTGGRARREQLVVRRRSGESDDRALHGADEGERYGSGRRAAGDAPGSPPRVDQAGAALEERFGDPLEPASNGMVLTAELEPQGDRHAGHVSPAVDGVTARQSDQCENWIRLLLDQPADLVPPGLIYPLDHRQGA